MRIFVGLTDFVQRGVLILVDEIPRYKNYHYYYYYSLAFIDIKDRYWIVNTQTTAKIISGKKTKFTITQAKV